MPYKSDAQRRFMHARHPEIAKQWDKKYGGGGGNLPEHVRQNSMKKRLNPNFKNVAPQPGQNKSRPAEKAVKKQQLVGQLAKQAHKASNKKQHQRVVNQNKLMKMKALERRTGK